VGIGASDIMTDKQRVFVEEYLTTWNATEAARRAGYAFPNVEGARLLVNPSIAETIKARVAEKVMTADEVLVRLAGHARATIEDIAQITDKGTFVLDLNKARRDGKLGMIKKIKAQKVGYELELHDQQAALVHIGKVHGLFIDKQNVNLQGSLDVNLGSLAVTDIDREIMALVDTARARTAGAAGTGEEV
jgi:phage terminase small subunit